MRSNKNNVPIVSRTQLYLSALRCVQVYRNLKKVAKASSRVPASRWVKAGVQHSGPKGALREISHIDKQSALQSALPVGKQ